MPVPRPAAPSALRRRGFLLGGLGALVSGAVGCTRAPAPVDGGRPPATPAASPTATGGAARPSARPTFPGGRTAAGREQGVADLCAALLSGPRGNDLDPDARRLLASVGRAHDAHAAALRSSDPTTRPSGPVPQRDPDAADELSGLTPTAALALIARRERRLAGHHRTAAVDATGSAALLWGSLAVAAEAYGRALAGQGPAVTRPPEPASVPELSEVRAMQTLVAQLHAVVYGYQVALGRLTGRSAARARADLRAVRALRDSLDAALTRRAAPVPVPAPAYVPSPAVRDAASAAELARHLETALLPFCGLWVASARTRSDRRSAQQALAATARRAAAWGARPSVWPGWPA